MFSKISTFFIVLFLILPIFIIIPMSFSSAQFLTFPPPGFSLQWYHSFFSDSQWIDATITSLQVGVLTTLLSLVLGILAAEGLVKSDFPGKNFIQELFMLPMIVPTIIVAIAVYNFQSHMGMTGTTIGLVTAHTILAIPFVITPVLAGLKGMDPNLENAAMSLGANRLQTFFKVTLPNIKSSVFSGAMFAFATSFDELVVTLFISGITVTTLPKRIWDGVRTQLDPTIASISSILIVAVVIFMFISIIVGNKKKDNSVIEETLPNQI